MPIARSTLQPSALRGTWSWASLAAEAPADNLSAIRHLPRVRGWYGIQGRFRQRHAEETGKRNDDDDDDDDEFETRTGRWENSRSPGDRTESVLLDEINPAGQRFTTAQHSSSTKPQLTTVFGSVVKKRPGAHFAANMSRKRSLFTVLNKNCCVLCLSPANVMMSKSLGDGT
ncbi:unnamed protein product [Soboliphyme baturini]|uniref:Secreted protein n=1 Tax=Soboliphyme baturini TaxID=241478 RepID=A0A183JA53_9BILA|nr:unnamed protein product [Soboliphyme baturini]